MTKMTKTKERYLGCLVGLAIGDALGAPFEWSKIPFQATDMVGGGSHNMKVGSWTDDTSMALCLADSLVKCDAFNAKDQLTRYSLWMNEGYLSAEGKCAGIGRTTRLSLELFKKTGNTYSGIYDENIAGNGSLMRLAPIPMFFNKNMSMAKHNAFQSSITTHKHAQCIDACELFSEMLWKALHGYKKKDIFKIAKDRKFRTEEVEKIAFKKTYKGNPPYIKGTGHVIKSLEAALWAFHKSRSFKHGALLAVNLGDDADTTGAIYGQIAGAYYGYKGIPEAWRNKLVKRDIIEQLALKLYERKW